MPDDYMSTLKLPYQANCLFYYDLIKSKISEGHKQKEKVTRAILLYVCFFLLQYSYFYVGTLTAYGIF